MIKRLSNTLAVVVMMLLAPLSAQAASEWVIGPIHAQSTSGLSYCSMKNVAEGGVTIIFARDTAASDTIAFEFTEKSFRPGVQFSAVLRVGEAQRNVPAIAGTNRVLMAQLGKDPLFYELLNRKSSLQAVVAGKSMEFSLSGSARAFEALDNCLAASVAGQKPPKVIVEGSAAVSVENRAIDLPITSVKSSYTNVTKPEMKSFSPAQQARTEILQQEVDRLRMENRKLLLESQRFEAEALAAAQHMADGLEDERRVLTKAEENTRLSAISSATKEIPQAAGEKFADTVAAYIRDAAVLCDGDFAHKLGTVMNIGGKTIKEGEMACVTDQGGGAAALLFIEEKGKATVLERKGDISQMERVLSERSRALTELQRGG